MNAVLPETRRPMTLVERHIAARVWFYCVQGAKQAVAAAERKMLAARSPQDRTCAERNLLEKHRALAKAREWRA